MSKPVIHSLAEWLNYIERVHPRTIDLGLERIVQVAAKLDLLSWCCPVITVAGTNGKGSCVALLNAILTAAGYKVGCYTSPHLLDYKERINLAGHPATETALCTALAQVETARDNISLTYFEFSTLAALLLFKQAALDAVILEVGMGGRLDAVNSVDADIALISTVALDHQAWLGETREQIAAEKAGIMRSGKPCIYGELDVPTAIKTQAHTLGVPLYCQAQDFGYQCDSGPCRAYSSRPNFPLEIKESVTLHLQNALEDASHKDGHLNNPPTSTWSWWNQTQQWKLLPIPRLALQNAACVLQAVDLLHPRLPVSPHTITQGLIRASLPARFQVTEGPVTVILDVAHNPAASHWLADQLRNLSRPGRTLAVVGMLADKDIGSTLAPLLTLIDIWYLGSLTMSRGASAEQLQCHLQSLTTTATRYVCSTITSAYRQALQQARVGDTLLIMGSFYTVAEIMRLRL